MFRLPPSNPCFFPFPVNSTPYAHMPIYQGSWDTYLSDLFVDLKQRRPDRVFLLMGNRDINKLRFAAELGDDDLQV